MDTQAAAERVGGAAASGDLGLLAVSEVGWGVGGVVMCARSCLCACVGVGVDSAKHGWKSFSYCFLIARITTLLT